MRGFLSSVRTLLVRLLRLLREVSYLASILEAHSIARRMFVTNAFDSLLSTLGIIMGLYVANVKEPSSYIGAVAGGVGVMGVFSGFLATYLSERSERLRELRETERVMLHDLKGSIYWRAARVVPLYVALWSAAGAILLPMLSITPLFLAAAMELSVDFTIIGSCLALLLASMFMIGFYLGRLSGENPWLNGARFLGIGVAAASIMMLLKVFTS